MDAEEAREIVKGRLEDPLDSRGVWPSQYFFAKGYLAALDGPEMRDFLFKIDNFLKGYGDRFDLQDALNKFRATAGVKEL